MAGYIPTQEDRDWLDEASRVTFGSRLMNLKGGDLASKFCGHFGLGDDLKTARAHGGEDDKLRMTIAAVVKAVAKFDAEED